MTPREMFLSFVPALEGDLVEAGRVLSKASQLLNVSPLLRAITLKGWASEFAAWRQSNEIFPEDVAAELFILMKQRDSKSET